MRRTLVRMARAVIARVLKRQVVFLPVGSRAIVFDAAPAAHLMPLRYTYRASPEGVVRYEMRVGGSYLRYRLHAMTFPNGPYERPAPGEVCLALEAPRVASGDVLAVSVVDGAAWLNGTRVDVERTDHAPSRKFIANVTLSTDRAPLARLCSHYLPFEGKGIGRDYYFGDDYVDYPRHTDVGYAVNLLRKHRCAGRVLDVGCALGLYTKAFLDAGWDAHGVDVSEFAVAEAQKLVGQDRVRQCDLDAAGVPFEGRFDVVWMWDVLEHSASPEGLLEKITERTGPGSWLFLRTSNAESLMHRVLGADWEGYSDYSHHGVDRVSATSVRAWLKGQGWEIVEWTCDGIWVAGADPVVLRLREAFESIPELTAWLAERDVGDMITVVARKGAREREGEGRRRSAGEEDART